MNQTLNSLRCIKQLLLCLLLFLCAMACFGSILKAPKHFILEDKQRNLTVSDALKAWNKNQFSTFPTNGFNPGFTTSAFWIAVQLPKESQKDYFVRIGNAHINQIDFYEVTGKKANILYKTGDHLPFNSRPLNTRLFVFPLKKAIENNGLYLVRVDKHHESLQLSVDLFEKDAYHYIKSNEQLIGGIFFGIILLVILFCLFLFFSVKDYLYLYFILFVLSMFLWIAADKGFGYQYFWPDFPQFASRARPIFSCASSLTALLFISSFLGLNKAEKLYKRIKWLVIIGLSQLTIFILPIDYLQFPNWCMALLAMHTIWGFFVIAISVQLALKKGLAGNKNAWFLLVAFLSLFSFSTGELLIHSGSNTIYGNYLSQFGIPTGMVIATIILTFGLAYRFNTYRKDREQLLIAINNEQLAYAAGLREVQENERHKISEQLHDDVGTMLSVIALQISSVNNREIEAPSAIKEKLAIASDALQQVSSTVRNLSHILMPLNLEKSGFIAAIKDLITSIGISGKIQIEQVIIGFEDIEKYNKTALLDMYRIIQELLNNILKHSDAKNALLELIEHDDAVIILVEDNGKGIGKQDSIKNGKGLSNLSAKVAYFNGQIEILDKADGGTLITIELPSDKLI